MTYLISLLAISRRHIDRLIRNLDRKYRITYQYRTRDQNSNFRKFKMRTAAIFKIALSPYISRQLSDFDQIWYTGANFPSEHGNMRKKSILFQIQDGGRTPYWKSFLAISRHRIDRLLRISEWRWRITCIYRSRDQNGNFHKFKMADGRHFENSFISISQTWIIRFWSNLVHRCKFTFRALQFDQKKSKCFKFKMADRSRIENRIFAIYRRPIGRLMRISERRWRITCRYRSCDQNGNFRKFKMVDGRHFENSFNSIPQSWIIRFRSNLVRRCKFPFRGWLFDKNRNFSSSRWRTEAIWKIVFWLYLGAVLAD